MDTRQNSKIIRDFTKIGALTSCNPTFACTPAASHTSHIIKVLLKVLRVQAKAPARLDSRVKGKFTHCKWCILISALAIAVLVQLK